MQTKALRHTTQMFETIALLQTLQELEEYRAFCYQLYLCALATLTNHTNNQSVTFTYGAGGERYMKETSTGKYTFYLGKAYEEQVEDNTEKQICYITLGGKTIGTHTEVKDTNYVTTNSNYNEATYNRYFHADALGSIVAITDDTGTVVERRSYEAFGKIRAMDYGLTNNNAIIPSNTVAETTRAYTGHEQIKEISGLIHMNARIYDSDIGRFLSADTVIQDPLDSQAYNRYSYVRNNPMKFTDPTGHSWFSKMWKKVKKAWKKVVGAVLIIVGVGVAYLVPGGQTIGAAITGAGVSLYNYDKTGKFEFQAPIIDTGGGGNSEAEQVASLQEQSDAIDRAQSGTTPTSASPVSNDNFANGTATDAYAQTGGNDSYSENSDGSITLAPITVTALPQGYEWIEDLPSYTYEAFTYTNIGGVIDVGYQYYRGEIGGYYAAGLLGATALGGKVAGKAFEYSTAVRIQGPWSISDIKQGLLGYSPRGLGKPDLHHRGQMPGSGIDEYLPSFHRGNISLHPNKYNQGVTSEMRQSDRELHWWYRAREMGGEGI